MTDLWRWVTLGLFCLCLGWPPPASAARRDTVADLDALAASEAWQELGDHLADIPPAERDPHWEKLVEQAALGELAPLAAASSVTRLDVLKRWYPTFPSLAGSDRFMALRQKIGLAVIARCFDDGSSDPSQCLDELDRFVRIAPVRAADAEGAAHLAAVKMRRAAATPFFALALDAPGNAPGNATVCKDGTLADAAIDGFDLPPAAREAASARLLLDKCWEALGKPVADAFAREAGGAHYLSNACPSLLAHDVLTGLRAARCKAVLAKE